MLLHQTFQWKASHFAQAPAPRKTDVGPTPTCCHWVPIRQKTRRDTLPKPKKTQEVPSTAASTPNATWGNANAASYLLNSRVDGPSDLFYPVRKEIEREKWYHRLSCCSMPARAVRRRLSDFHSFHAFFLTGSALLTCSARRNMNTPPYQRIFVGTGESVLHLLTLVLLASSNPLS